MNHYFTGAQRAVLEHSFLYENTFGTVSCAQAVESKALHTHSRIIFGSSGNASESFCISHRRGYHTFSLTIEILHSKSIEALGIELYVVLGVAKPVKEIITGVYTCIRYVSHILLHAIFISGELPGLTI